MGVAILIGLVLILVIVGLVAYFITIYKSLVRLRNDIQKAWASIDVLLKQRHDELPKLIETCRGYMQYEQKTLQAVTEARTVFMRANTPAEKARADSLVSGALKSLFAVAGKYPDLKANTSFVQLQGRLTDLETKIAAQRGAYDEDVNAFNLRIAQIPASLVAGFTGLRPHALFQVAETDREDAKVSFT